MIGDNRYNFPGGSDWVGVTQARLRPISSALSVLGHWTLEGLRDIGFSNVFKHFGTEDGARDFAQRLGITIID